MNKLKDNEGNIVDRYYGENDSETKKTGIGIRIGTRAGAKPEPENNTKAEDLEFEVELNKSMELMNVFCDDDIKVPNDFFSIIEKAEEIKTKKESNREFVIFILASLGILLSIAAITIQVGVKIFIIMQVALYFILPISLIPISIAAVKRGEAR